MNELEKFLKELELRKVRFEERMSAYEVAHIAITVLLIAAFLFSVFLNAVR